ncbi:MAG: PDZ domain-containing protein [Archangium sp.]
MLSVTLLALLSASPEFIEPWGFSLGTRDDAVVIASVRPDSPAAVAKLNVGDVLLRVRSPKPPPEARGTLDEAALLPVTKFLGSLKDEVLLIDLAGESSSRGLRRSVFKMKSGDELKKLTPMEMSLYFGQLNNKGLPPSTSVPGIDFGPQRGKVTAWVDPKSKRLVAVNAGGATGEQLWGTFAASYRCIGVKAHTLTVTGEALRTPVYVDLKPDKLQGGAHEVVVPLATLEAVTKCPKTPLVTTLELTLTCEDGSTVEGRERPVLEVKCERPEAYEPPVFTAWQPFTSERVTEGTPTFGVNPMNTSGPKPTRVDVLVLRGDDVVASLPNAWTAKEAAEFKRVNVPAPKKPGAYEVVFEATWSDGSKSRSERAPLQVLTRAEAKASADAISAGSLAMSAVQARMKEERVDICDTKAAMAWLKKQPEVDKVTEIRDTGDYQFTVKGWSMPNLVHCHEK